MKINGDGSLETPPIRAFLNVAHQPWIKPGKVSRVHMGNASVRLSEKKGDYHVY
jgi:hypothetical protein